ncbi:MAG: Cof-type HAD-IIB family hydrolase [Coprobacillaceae bacterium]
MKNKIKLIMSDIDGTLLNSKHEVTDVTKEAISKAREQGILFGIATGRALDAVTLLTPDWGIDHLVDVYMGYNGAHVIDYPLGVNEHSHMIEGKYFKEIIDHYKDLDVTMCVYVGRTLYSSRQDARSDSLTKNNKFTEEPMDMETLFLEPRSKLVIACDEEYMDTVIERSKSLNNPAYRCFRSAPTLFEYVHPEVSKSFGINKICKLHGFTIDNVLAFGDAGNDYEMIRDCGVGVCMSNGSDDTKSVADYITDSNDEDGIATFINKYLL